MTTTDCLRRAIIENPADIAPRLALADLLEESGNDAGAAFIRLPGPIRLWRERYGRWRLTSNGWYSPLPPGTGAAWGVVPLGVRRELDEIVIRHGFVEEIGTHMSGFMRVAINRRLFASHPVREVRIGDRRPANDDGDPPVHSWSGTSLPTGDVPYGTERLPISISNLLGVDFWRYPSPEAAHADLSAACVAYGRLRAGKEKR